MWTGFIWKGKEKNGRVCENDDEARGFHNTREFLEQLRNYHIFKIDYVL